MPATRLFGTFTFQIAVLYLALFSATLIGLLAFIYWSTSQLIDRQMNETIEAEIGGLSEQYRSEGLTGLIDVVRARSVRNRDLDSVYLLTDPLYRRLAGNLAKWPERPETTGDWTEIRLRRTDGDDTKERIFRARQFELRGGFHLLVGRDTEARGNFRRIMKEGFAWALVPVLVLGLGGGVLVGRYALRRVDAVAATSHEIVKGDLGRRVPLSGSGDEFDRLGRTINEMLDQIDQLMTGMRLVTDSLAHDLRSPLTRAKGNIELTLRHEADPEGCRQALEQVSTELDTILRTFEALINIADAEAGTSRPTMTAMDLSDLLRDVFEMYLPIAEDAGLDLVGTITPDVTVTGHRQLLGQAVANLLDNAIKFTAHGGKIEVSLAADPQGSVLRVSDNGPGIPAEHRERVLERFVRLDNSRTAPGSGLGLSLVAAVARMHNAALSLDDNGPGLVATLRFPPA